MKKMKLVCDVADFDKTEVNVASFTNGELNEKTKDRILIRSFGYKNSNDPKLKKRRLLVAETKHVHYIGKNFGADLPCYASLNKYCVGVVDKKTGKMKIVKANMFNMIPRLPGEKYEDIVGGSGNDGLSFMEKVDNLTEVFGSRKKRLRMNSRQRNTVKGTALDTAMSTAASNTDIVDNDTSLTATPGSHEQDQSDTFPPMDKEAKSRADVFNIDDIISPAEFEALKNAENVFMDIPSGQINEWLREEKYPSYVCSHLSVLSVMEEERSIEARRLLYLVYLIRLYKIRRMEMKKIDEIMSDVPDDVRNQLYDKFTIISQPSGTRKIRSIPVRVKNKILVYALVLCLFLDEYKVPLIDLQKDFRIGSTRLNHIMRCLGCTLTSTTIDGVKQYVAALKIPLTFPTENPKKKGRK
ncbi:DNA-directed RNA polymerase I subunit RPA49-like [Tubulanus polymorphus]|uniref:DNA-directed RNA polymerase I subunit RPA49-like n=1 Tax=Tubulanus polymorphus TaxID=672921 RepID=UPI003DA35F23